MENPLRKMIQTHKNEKPVGIYSVCSANPFVLEAAMHQAKEDGSGLLIESTSNQVDQFGGYTGLTPRQFRDFVFNIANTAGLPAGRIILGGDHLGPNAWQNQNSAIAMENARELIRAYVEAGFTKIHLDTSMRCADDPGDPRSLFDTRIVARRAAELCEVAENAAAHRSADLSAPVYVIGTDVPIPGGAQEELSSLRITPVNELEETIEITRKAFYERGLHDAWERVLAVVVQPGVEFGDTNVFEYDRTRAHNLSRFIDRYPNLLFEAHSTDYQKKEMLRMMVEDHFAILKVGPWLTFALREAVFGLSHIEDEWVARKKGATVSDIRAVLDRVMLNNPAHWRKHYHGDDHSLAFARRYSYSDRLRYYWPDPSVEKALQQLIKNLQKYLPPLTLISQYLPGQYFAVREGSIENTPADLIRHKIREVLNIYSYAASGNIRS